MENTNLPIAANESDDWCLLNCKSNNNKVLYYNLLFEKIYVYLHPLIQ